MRSEMHHFRELGADGVVVFGCLYKRREAGYETHGKPDAEDDGECCHAQQSI